MHGAQYGQHQQYPVPYANTGAMSSTNLMGIGMNANLDGNGAIFNDIFMYAGNPIGLQARIDSLSPDETSNIRQATIICNGAEIKQMNICCALSTAIGGILIFPLFFMCCDWWKKIVYPAFQIPLSTYHAFGKLLSLPSLKTITLNLVDNKLDDIKCQVLYDALSKSESLKGFYFSNNALMYNFQSEQFSRFKDNMRSIKKLPFVSEIRWGTSLVL